MNSGSPMFENVNLNADEWAALACCPQALEIAQASAEAIDDCGFIGEGTPTYLDPAPATFAARYLSVLVDTGCTKLFPQQRIAGMSFAYPLARRRH